MRARIGALGIVVLLFSAFVAAQTGTIAGSVRDESGEVLPGVTIEASSPALIEKFRSVVTDSKGRYQLTSLPVGTYEVSFRLQGFRTLIRSGVVLTSDVTATVDARPEGRHH